MARVVGNGLDGLHRIRLTILPGGHHRCAHQRSGSTAARVRTADVARDEAGGQQGASAAIGGLLNDDDLAVEDLDDVGLSEAHTDHRNHGGPCGREDAEVAGFWVGAVGDVFAGDGIFLIGDDGTIGQGQHDAGVFEDLADVSVADLSGDGAKAWSGR